jgi:hypothetical protein
MTTTNNYAAVPAFGKKVCVPEFYTAVSRIIATLRPLATRRTIAAALNKAGFTTAQGLTWTPDRVTAFVRFSAVPVTN